PYRWSSHRAVLLRIEDVPGTFLRPAALGPAVRPAPPGQARRLASVCERGRASPPPHASTALPERRRPASPGVAPLPPSRSAPGLRGHAIDGCDRDWFPSWRAASPVVAVFP